MSGDKSFDVVEVPVYSEMKMIDLGACKAGIPCYGFIWGEAVKAVREGLVERGGIGDDEILPSKMATEDYDVVLRLSHDWTWAAPITLGDFSGA